MNEPEPAQLVSGDSRIEMSIHGARIIGDLTLPQWQHHMQSLRLVKTAYHRGLADLVSYGKKQFGDAVVESTMTQLEFDLSDAFRALSISALSDGARAVEQLSSEHQYVLGRCCETPEDQERWAQVAVEEKLNPSDLKASIAAGLVVRARGGATGVPSFEAILAQFRRVKKAFEVSKMSRSDRERILEVLRPILDFAGGLVEA